LASPVNISITFPLNVPTYYSSSGAAAPASTAFAPLPNLATNMTLSGFFIYFDKYRVHSLTVQHMPRYVDTSLQPSTNDYENSVDVYNDPDDMSGATFPTYLDRGVPLRQINQGKTVTFKFIQPLAERNIWYNCANANIAPGTASSSSTTTSPTFYKSMKMLFPATAASLQCGRLYATWDVELRAPV